MSRSHSQLQEIQCLKKESRTRECRLSMVTAEGGVREYFAFNNGKLEIYDTIGIAKDQVPLTKEELQVVRQLEKKLPHRQTIDNNKRFPHVSFQSARANSSAAPPN